MDHAATLLSAVTLSIAVLSSSFCEAEVIVIAGPLSVNGDFGLKEKVRRSLSGAACTATAKGRYVCLAAFDEGAESRTFTINEKEYDANDQPVVFIPNGGEMDSEAVAADGGYYYVAGSHANKRQSCDLNPTSHRVVRIAYDKATGLPLRTKDGELKDIDDSFDMKSMLKGDLANSLGKCLGTEGGGFDIEGLAFYSGRLYFGLRGPTSPDQTSATNGAIAYVVEAPSDPSLTRPANARDPFRIKVGHGQAIRDMAAVKGGILLLLGPDDDNGHVGWSIAIWKVDENADRKETVTPLELGALDLSKILRSSCDKEVKPEGMAYLDSRNAGNGTVYRLAIFSDGMCDGGPVIVEASD